MKVEEAIANLRAVIAQIDRAIELLERLAASPQETKKKSTKRKRKT